MKPDNSPAKAPVNFHVADLGLTAPSVFPPMEGTIISSLLAKDSNTTVPSNIPQRVQLVPRLYDKDKMAQAMLLDPHHMTCLRAKVSATVGLGFMSEEELREKEEMKRAKARMAAGVAPEQPTKEKAQELVKQIMDPSRKRSKADDVLDPLTNFSWQDLVTQLDYDFEMGDAYMEVKRDAANRIVALHRIQPSSVQPAVDTRTGEFHYVVRATAESEVAGTLHFPRYGQKDIFISRIQGYVANGDGVTIRGFSAGSQSVNPEMISEIVHFRLPGPFSNYFGFPDWLPAIAQVELSKAVTQHKFDFYFNRGVPEFLVAVLGQVMEETKWNEFVDKLKANQGTPNKRKSAAINLGDPDAKIEVKPLGAIDSNDTYKDDSEAIAIKIVTAHGVPPVLANILIPGKMGAANETVSSLLSFQLLTVAARQRIIERTLAQTLGSESAGLGLTPDDFVLRRITDLMDLENMDTMSRMKTEMPVAQAQGRKMEDGLKD